jgi:hypothetical protein
LASFGNLKVNYKNPIKLFQCGGDFSDEKIISGFGPV